MTNVAQARYSFTTVSSGIDPLIHTWIPYSSGSEGGLESQCGTVAALAWSQREGWKASPLQRVVDRETDLLDLGQLIRSIDFSQEGAFPCEDGRCSQLEQQLRLTLYWAGIATIGPVAVVVVETLLFAGFVTRPCSKSSGQRVDICLDVSRVNDRLAQRSLVVIPYEELGSGVLLTAEMLSPALKRIQDVIMTT